MAHRVVSLRRTPTIAIEGEADVSWMSRNTRGWRQSAPPSDVNDPEQSSIQRGFRDPDVTDRARHVSF